MSKSMDRANQAASMVERKVAMTKRIQALKSEGYSNTQIAEQLKINESTILVLLSST